MRIVIVGAGAVGSYLAGRLSSEGQDVVVIESDPVRAAESQDALDVMVLTGNGASPAVLSEAGVKDADLLIAVSNSDGVNMLACHAASRLGVARTVARVEEPGLQAGLAGIELDVIIDPAESAAHELVDLVRQGGVSDLVAFGEGRLQLVGGVVQHGSWITGSKLANLRREIDNFNWLIAVIVRHGKTIVATGETEVENGDHVLMMVTQGHVEDATRLMGLKRQSITRAVILGSTHLAELTATTMLEEGFDVAIVDPDPVRSRALAEAHAKVLVTCGGLTDPATLRELGRGTHDAVLALSGWDEINIVGCLLAKEIGAALTVTRINNQAVRGLLGDVGIDATVSSRLAAANAILRFVRRGLIHSVATFSDTDAEAIELEVSPNSVAVDKPIVDLGLPAESLIGGVLRDGDAFVPAGHSTIRAGDILIIFSLPSAIQTVERLFAE